MTPVVALGVDAVESEHTLGQVRLGGFEYQVIVVVHQAVGVAEPVTADHNLAQALQEGVAICVVLEDASRALPRTSHGRSPHQIVL